MRFGVRSGSEAFVLHGICTAADGKRNCAYYLRLRGRYARRAEHR